MTYLARTREGSEEISISFLKKHSATKISSPQPGVILFTNKTIPEHSTFQYVYEFIKEIKTLEEAKKIDYSKIKAPFRVKCRKKKGGDLSTLDIERDLGEHIHETHSKEVNLTKPKTTVIVEMIKDKIYICQTAEDKKISQKEYRVKTNPNSLTADLANTLLIAIDYKPSQAILDPFCGTGEILIEASLQKGKKIYGLDSNEFNIKKAKFSAKVAGVKLDLSKADVDWLDTKFKEGEINHIVTSLPTPNKFLKSRDILTNYKDLFNQAKFILKKTGTLTLITTKPQLLEEIPLEGFKEDKKYIISSGDVKHTLIIYKK